MKTKLFLVAEGLLDEANEAIYENLMTSENVQAYAENAMEIILSDEHAELVMKACKNWLDSDDQTANNYYHDVERVLESNEVKTELVIEAAETVPYAKNLSQLCDRLNTVEQLVREQELHSRCYVKVTCVVDTSSLPTFGGSDVSEEGIYSWDECSLLRQVDGVWQCIDRGEYLIEQAYLED